MIDHVISNLQLDGNRAIKWFTDNGMQANPDKFQFMIISSDDNSTRSLTLNENTVIVSEKHVKVLGVVIDCKKARQLNALLNTVWFILWQVAWNGKYNIPCHFKTSNPFAWGIQIHTPLESEAYQWYLWSKTYELLFEKHRKIGTTNEKDIDLWSTISLIYWCKIMEWFIPFFTQWCRDRRF